MWDLLQNCEIMVGGLKMGGELKEHNFLTLFKSF